MRRDLRASDRAVPGLSDSRIGLDEHLTHAGVDVVDIDPDDAEALEPRPLTRDELHVAFLHAERVRDQRCRRRVRPSVDRWSRDPQLQLIAVSADDGASTRPRLDVHP